MEEMTIRVEIEDYSYESTVPADEWEEMTGYEKIETLKEREEEARDHYCAPLTSVTVTDPNGNEVEI